MHREFLMGNEAIALGALAAGVQVAAGYPGTPSTEVLETLARRRPQGVYVEWSVNEKAALEVAAGAAYSGARALVTMKQVGLNVASDPLMSLSYIGVKGALVVLVADDPGPISSQTEQDTRTFGMYSKIPVFDPSDAREAFRMMGDAFRLSEEYGTPVIVRPTTRIDHAYRDMEVPDEDEYERHPAEGFVRDPSRWVIFPRLSTANHAKMEARNDELSRVLSRYPGNMVLPEEGVRGRGIVSQGASWTYVLEALPEDARPRLMKVGTPFPFPEDLALDFLSGLDEVLAVEELDPVLERALQDVIGRHGLSVRVRGKRDGTVKRAGENTPGEVRAAVRGWLGAKGGAAPAAAAREDLPPLPVRAPVLCAGCPHRASFYAVKRAMQGQKAVFCGDIGCYTLGNAKPLDMCDTCLCMGAGIDIAQGIARVDPGTKAFAFVGDSTFFASGMTGVLNGVYNGADMTLVVLDNSTTAMTGHQPHPGTGRPMMGEVVEKVSIEAVLRAIGLTCVETVDPLDHRHAIETVRRVADEPGVKAIIFKSPCVVLAKPTGKCVVDADKCIGCRSCINLLGCPALFPEGKKAKIDDSLCVGCTLCKQVCPVGAISGGEQQ